MIMNHKTTLLTLLLALTAGVRPAAGEEYGGAPAQFDYFEYTGCDDYYRMYPLRDDSSFHNPIIPGFHSDPAICRVGEDYYLVMSTFCYYPGVPLYHSKDLVNWTLAGNVLNRPSQLPGLPGQELGKGGIYAPDISYNPRTKTFYMLTTDVGRGHFYVTTRHPLQNNWSDPVWLPSIDGIDPAFFFDDDGSSYIIYKEDTEGKPKWSNHRSIRIIRFDTATGQTVGEPVKFREEGVGPEERLARNEGPHLYKINGKYYIICAEGGTGNFHSEVVYRSDSVSGPYTRWSRNPMLTQRLLKDNRPNAVTCTGHADMVRTADGEWWAVFLGCRPGPGGSEQLGRETFIMPVAWSRDGFPYITQEKDTVPLTLSRRGVRRDTMTTFGNFTWRDDFGGTSLRPEWLSFWGSAESHVSLSGGSLRITPSAAIPQDRRTPALLCRRIQHHKFSAETRMTASSEAGSRSGMVVFKNENRYYFFGISNGRIVVEQSGKDRSARELASVPAPTDSGTATLRAVCHGDRYDFLYSTDGSGWHTVAEGVGAAFVSQQAGGFTGTTIGVCAWR